MKVIELVKVNKVYDMGAEVQVNALKDISLSIERGEYVAIMGPSGSGKTTLMNILGCLDTPTSGLYLFDGVNVSDIEKIRGSPLHLDIIGRHVLVLERAHSANHGCHGSKKRGLLSNLVGVIYLQVTPISEFPPILARVHPRPLLDVEDVGTDR